MSDDLLLSLLWFVPLAGCLIVLLFPKRAELAIKGFSLGVTLVTFARRLMPRHHRVTASTNPCKYPVNDLARWPPGTLR